MAMAGVGDVEGRARHMLCPPRVSTGIVRVHRVCVHRVRSRHMPRCLRCLPRSLPFPLPRSLHLSHHRPSSVTPCPVREVRCVSLGCVSLALVTCCALPLSLFLFDSSSPSLFCDLVTSLPPTLSRLQSVSLCVCVHALPLSLFGSLVLLLFCSRARCVVAPAGALVCALPPLCVCVCVLGRENPSTRSIGSCFRSIITSCLRGIQTEPSLDNRQ